MPKKKPKNNNSPTSEEEKQEPDKDSESEYKVSTELIIDCLSSIQEESSDSIQPNSSELASASQRFGLVEIIEL